MAIYDIANNSPTSFNLGTSYQPGELLKQVGGLSGTGTGTTTPDATKGIFGQTTDWLGDNSQGLGSLLQGIGALSSLFSTNSQLGLAKDNFNFQKDAYNTNLANQVSTYNTNLEDKIRGRYSTADQSESQVQNYLNKNKLSS